jgi:uncharacterized protein with GYD domain|tara:strand:- start:151 stop:462 length:312 start_codon:yes stop_codon:yes gene_type:complete
MLFLVHIRHDGAHCPGYRPEVLPKWVEALERRHEIAAKLGVKLHGMYSMLPEHGEVAIVEADAPTQIAGLVTQLLPSEQAEIIMTPVTPVEEMPALARQTSGG